MFELIPIQQTIEQNGAFTKESTLAEVLTMTIGYYQMIGYQIPWIGYFARLDGKWVGSAGFKGGPRDGKIEIAYGTFEPFQQQGIGTRICEAMVKLAQKHDPNVMITARTLPESLASNRILEKNGFQLQGTVIDPEDGEVWEWLYVA